MNSYADILFQNGTLSNDNADSVLSYNFLNQFGGKVNKSNNIGGGFPPLRLCTNKQSKKETKDNKKKREFQTKNNKNLVSIQTILQKRRDTIPFLATEGTLVNTDDVFYSSDSSEQMHHGHKVKYNKPKISRIKKKSKKKKSKKKKSKK